MLSLYNRVAVPILRLGITLGARVNSKLKRAVEGRVGLLNETQKHYDCIAPDRKRLLIHVSSFGELEQAKPVIEALRKERPGVHIHLTFFSPSGYENAHEKYAVPDLITYLPFDREEDVRTFLDIAQPHIALFARYDVWPNMVHELRRRAIPSILFSATFDPKRENGIVRKLHLETYDQLDKILTISANDRRGFEQLGVSGPEIIAAGDTRFDQVLARRASVEAGGLHSIPENICERINRDGTFVLVAGSTWPADERVLKSVLKKALARKDNMLTLLVPHEPSAKRVSSLLSAFGNDAIALSQSQQYRGEKVIVVDSIGKLFGLYREADAAYVGGGFSAGVHNVIEPAVWRKPVIFGPKHTRSQEVQQLADALAGFEITNSRELEFVLWRFLSDEDFRNQAGSNAEQFVKQGSGATWRIVKEILEFEI